MPTKFRLEGGGSGRVASVINHSGIENGLVTYTHPYDHYQYLVEYLTNEDFGKALNQSPTSATPTTTTIYDGGDTTAWTPSTITGGGSAFNFTSTDTVRTGLQSIDATSSDNNDIMALTAPAPINPTDIFEFRLWIFIESWSGSGTKDVTVQWFSNGSAVSNEVPLSNYVDTNNEDVWQRADFPIGDFSITSATVDQLRIKTVDEGRGSAPNYHLDDIQYLSVGAAIDVYEYRWEAEYGEEYYLSSLRFTALTSGKTNLDSGEFFGIPALATGIELVYRNDKEIFQALDARDMFTILSWGDVHPTVEGSQNNVTLIVDFHIPADQFRLDGSNGDYIAIRVRDDLTGIDKFNCSAVLAKRVQR